MVLVRWLVVLGCPGFLGLLGGQAAGAPGQPLRAFAPAQALPGPESDPAARPGCRPPWFPEARVNHLWYRLTLTRAVHRHQPGPVPDASPWLQAPSPRAEVPTAPHWQAAAQGAPGRAPRASGLARRNLVVEVIPIQGRDCPCTLPWTYR